MIGESIMKRALRKEDALAVDLLLDGRIAAGETPQFITQGKVDRDRLGKIERLLDRLHLMAEPEVPADLVSRTLKFIDHAEVGAEVGVTASQPIISSRPHA